MGKIIGRKAEKAILESALKSNRPELIVVYGRRRIGKTFLIREVYKNHILIEFTGIYNATLKDQLKKFHLTISTEDNSLDSPSDWIEAFHHLGQFLDNYKSGKKKVVFIDEFPWFDTPKSRFLSAFDNFWNSYASKRSNLVVVVCGSAASYMIKKIVRNKGGLHNRLTHKIQLLPFNLNETEQLLKSNHVVLSRYDILQIYMAMGGIPHYLENINPGESVAQAIDRLCFEKDGFLRYEFKNIFASLFSYSDNHEVIIRTLATVRKGLTRNKILEKSKVSSGGTLTKTLDELEDSGFIEKYLPYQGTKDSVYRLTDEYSMFYIRFIENSKPSNQGVWIKKQGTQEYKIWTGFSFETICIKHTDLIKEGLKVAGVNSSHGSWIEKNKMNGAQIDLLIDRDDNVINLCEMKFYNTTFAIDKKYADEIENKKNTFIASTNTKKSIFITFITTYGLVSNQYSKQHVQKELTMDHLFAES